MAEQMQMEIQPADCPHCGAPSRALGGPWGLIRQPCQGCRTALRAADARRLSEEKRAERTRADEASGFPRRFRGLDLSGMKGGCRDHDVVLSACRQFVEGYLALEESGEGLLFIGTAGTGKTSMACATAQAVRDRYGRRVCYLRSSDLVDAAFERARAPDAFRHIETADLLVLDEVGAEGSHEFSAKVMTSLLDRRYADQRPTLLISNLPDQPGEPGEPPTLWEHLGVNVTDRLKATMQVLGCVWSSLRHGPLRTPNGR